jgi:hypothetical protein
LLPRGAVVMDAAWARRSRAWIPLLAEPPASVLED